jgi:uncharacterized membrane protein
MTAMATRDIGSQVMQRILLAALSMLLAYGGSGAAWAQATREGYGTHMWGRGYGWFFMPIMMIVFIAATVVVIVRWLGGTGHASSHQSYGPPKCGHCWHHS